MALTVPDAAMRLMYRPRHAGNWSSTNARTVSTETASWLLCIRTPGASRFSIVSANQHLPPFGGYARRMDKPSGSGRIRASDAERERVARFLATAFADGRLDLTEYDLRVAAAYAAVYRDDLTALVDDLPTPDTPLFDVKAGAPVPASAPTPAPRSASAAPLTAHERKRPYGWPVVVVLFAAALGLARLGMFGPLAMLLILFGLLIALSWIADDPYRRGRPPR
jgi:hypothetical protein